MIHSFSYQMVGTPDRWLLFYGQACAGEVFWIVQVHTPTVALDRIRDGLNGVFGRQDATRWSAVESSPGRWDLLEAGALVGELAWTHARMVERPTAGWTQRALDGLNADPEFCTASPADDIEAVA